MHRLLTLFVIALPLTVNQTLRCSAADSELAGIEFFENHIRPLLAQHCYECHSANSDSLMGGLRVDTREGLLKGGDSGPAVVPSDAQRSLIVSALRHEEFEMPPEGKLADEKIALFVQWIRMGAPDPRSSKSEMPHPAQHPGEGEFWAFEPPKQNSLPEVADHSWPLTEIDRFILAQLEAHELRPVQDVDRRTLIRRAYFDLWGLPPDEKAVDDFLQDRSPGAFALVIDRLLNSPRFGERWGRHWLDAARYGESTGHERNFLYPHAWRYRDYVIDAFTGDKPYDQFILEQIAGDELPAADEAEREEQLVATGFLALGPRNLLGGDEEFLLDTADDQINVTMRTILGLTVSCARCHDHKFDPISTKEYYALAGIFLSTETLYGTQPGTAGGSNRHPSGLIPLGPDAARRQEEVAKHLAKIAAATKDFGSAQGALKRLNSLPEKTLASKQAELAEAQRLFDEQKSRLDELKGSLPELPGYAMGVRDAKKIIDTQVRISGDSGNRGDVAPRGLLACCKTDHPQSMPGNASGRLELAKWLVDPAHPLTARVAVNRLWHHLMGRGLVPTIDNFGRNGQMPSHPALLDWLAIQFQRDGWSLKTMIRCVMLSRTYQLSSEHDPHNFEIDPDNILRWRMSPRRLEAEAIRDAMLSVSGSLKWGAPEGGSVVAQLGDGCLVRQIDAEKLKAVDSVRSIYLPAARFFEPEALQVFDGASASLVVGVRAETNVPSQALYLLNNEFVIEQARLTARRLAQQAGANAKTRIERAYQWVLGREPSKSELQRSLSFIRSGEELLSQYDRPRQVEELWASFVQVLFAGGEFRHLY